MGQGIEGACVSPASSVARADEEDFASRRELVIGSVAEKHLLRSRQCREFGRSGLGKPQFWGPHEQGAGDQRLSSKQRVLGLSLSIPSQEHGEYSRQRVGVPGVHVVYCDWSVLSGTS